MGVDLTYMCNGDTKSEYKAADDEEGNVETDADQGNADDHDTAADYDAGPSTEDISCVWDDGNSKQ